MDITPEERTRRRERGWGVDVSDEEACTLNDLIITLSSSRMVIPKVASAV